MNFFDKIFKNWWDWPNEAVVEQSHGMRLEDGQGEHSQRLRRKMGEILLCLRANKWEGTSFWISSVQSLSRVWLFATTWTAAHQVSQSVTKSQSLLKLNVHWVTDVIQPSHALSSPSPSFNLSQHQGLLFCDDPVMFLTSGGHSIGVSASASVLPMNTQDWSPLGWTGWISLQSKGLSRLFSNTTVQKHQFFCAQFSL